MADDGASRESQQVGIAISGASNAPVLYTNYASVQVTPFEAIVTLALIDPNSADAVQKGEAETLSAPSVARIAMPHQVLLGLAMAIQQQVERSEYLAQYVKKDAGS